MPGKRSQSPDAEALHTQGLALFRSGRYEEASEILGLATALLPSEAGSIHLSLALGQLNHFKASQKVLEESLIHFPRSADVRAYLGTTLRTLGYLDRGIACYEEALALDPEHVGALWGLGLALGMAGRSEEGLAPLWRAVGLAPNFAAPHFHLGILCMVLGDREESHRQWRILQSLSPRYAERLEQALESPCFPPVSLSRNVHD